MRPRMVLVQHVIPAMLLATLSSCAFAAEAGGDLPAYARSMQPFENALKEPPVAEDVALLKQITPPNDIRDAHNSLTKAAESLAAALDEAQRQELKLSGEMKQQAMHSGLQAPVEIHCSSRYDTKLELPEEFVAACRTRQTASDAYTKAKISWANSLGSKCGLQMGLDPTTALQRCAEQPQ